VDKGHGRIEVRSIWTSEELNDYLDFPYVRQVFCIRREVTQIGKNRESCEIAYGITILRRCGATNIAKTLRWFAFNIRLALGLIGL
jgi:hypothetical protein